MTRRMVSRRVDIGTMVQLGDPRGEADAAVDAREGLGDGGRRGLKPDPASKLIVVGGASEADALVCGSRQLSQQKKDR